MALVLVRQTLHLFAIKLSPRAGTWAVLSASVESKVLARPRMSAFRGSWRVAGSFLVVIGFAWIFLRNVHSQYPLEDWLLWKYVKAILAVSVWGLACATFGCALVHRAVPGLRLSERLVVGTGCGVYSFYLLHLVGGLVGAFGPVFACGLPIVMLAVGGYLARDLFVRLPRRLKRLRFRFGITRHWHVPIALAGVAALLWLYLGTLTPRNAAFDSLWYHLGLGEGWAAAGGVERSVEGWYMSTLPDMAAMLYSWGFLLPTFDLFETMMVASHIEFLLFLATLAFVPLLVRSLVPSRAVGIAWVAIFLFPAVFIYDAGLHSGNDHVAAFFAIPAFFALRRLWRNFDERHALPLSMLLSAALLTKYQAASLVAGPALCVLAMGALRTKRNPLEALRVVAAVLLWGLLFTAPLWLRNWVWYGDPLYPALYQRLNLHPFNDDAASYMELMWRVNVWRPKGEGWEPILETLRQGFTYSFQSHAHRRFHGDWPYMGSLFTASLCLLPFLRGARRVWPLALSVQFGIFTWYWLSHVERYLQLLVPWMAVVVVATLILAWRSGKLIRLPVIGLVGLQVLWGGDAPFLRTHAMLGESPVVHAIALLESGFRHKPELRTRVAGGLQEIGDSLPQGSVIVLHDYNGRLGLRHRVIVDKPRYQGLIRYGTMQSPREVFDLFQRLGVTHVVWRANSDEYSTLNADLRFFEFVDNAIAKPQRVGGFYVGQMPSELPAFDTGDLAVYAGCRPTFEPGSYRLSELHVIEDGTQQRHQGRPLPKDGGELNKLLSEARYLVLGKKCRGPKITVPPGFRKVATRHGEELWVRAWSSNGER